MLQINVTEIDYCIHVTQLTSQSQRLVTIIYTYKLQIFITRKEHIKQLNEQRLVENDTVPGSCLLSLTPSGS